MAIKHLAKCNILIEYLSVNSILIFTENSTFIFSQTSAAICDTEKIENGIQLKRSKIKISLR